MWTQKGWGCPRPLALPAWPASVLRVTILVLLLLWATSKNFLLSRATRPGRKLPLLEVWILRRGYAEKFKLPRMTPFPTQNVLGQCESVESKMQLLDCTASGSHSLFQLPYPCLMSWVFLIPYPRAKSWSLLASITLMKKPLHQTNTSTDICN